MLVCMYILCMYQYVCVRFSCDSELMAICDADTIVGWMEKYVLFVNEVVLHDCDGN